MDKREIAIALEELMKRSREMHISPHAILEMEYRDLQNELFRNPNLSPAHVEDLYRGLRAFKRIQNQLEKELYALEKVKTESKFTAIRYGIKDVLCRLRKQKKGSGAMMEITPAQLKVEMERQCKYVCDDSVVMNIWVALSLQKPLLIEGPAGGGKTELAKVLATVFQTPLIRLQCYDGIDDTKALYEWNYQKQIIDIQRGIETDPFSAPYLLSRPILRALQSEDRSVLLIDEIDKTDEEFEANLLEVLSDFQVSIPEYGTVTANVIPPVILTSNANRDLSDALRRRCVYMWLDYPSVDKEATILMKKVQGIRPNLAFGIASSMSLIRNNVRLIKQPSVSESLDLANAFTHLQLRELSSASLNQLLPVFIKNKEDLDKMKERGGGEWILQNI